MKPKNNGTGFKERMEAARRKYNRRNYDMSFDDFLKKEEGLVLKRIHDRKHPESYTGLWDMIKEFFSNKNDAQERPPGAGKNDWS